MPWEVEPEPGVRLFALHSAPCTEAAWFFLIHSSLHSFTPLNTFNKNRSETAAKGESEGLIALKEKISPHGDDSDHELIMGHSRATCGTENKMNIGQTEDSVSLCHGAGQNH